MLIDGLNTLPMSGVVGPVRSVVDISRNLLTVSRYIASGSQGDSDSNPEGMPHPKTFKRRAALFCSAAIRPDQPIASMFFATTSRVLASSAVGLNSMTSVPAKISGK